MTISATTQGLRPGVCLSTSRPAVPFDGMLIYETDTNRVAVYDSSAWVYKTPDTTIGSVLQVVSTTKTDTFSSSTINAWTDVTGLSVSITPKFSNSKILVFATVTGNFYVVGTSGRGLRIARDSTALAVGDTAGSRVSSTSTDHQSNTEVQQSVTMQYLDSPASASSLTYKVQFFAQTGGTIYINRSAGDTDANYTQRTSSTITVMEIAG